MKTEKIFGLNINFCYNEICAEHGITKNDQETCIVGFT